MTRSANFAVLGDAETAAGLGKRGTQTDITLYDRKETGIIRTFVHPNGFPERIQPLLQAISMAEFAILDVPKLDRFAGEQIMALDMLDMDRGVLCHSYGVDESALEAAAKGTVLDNYKRGGRDEIRGMIQDMVLDTAGLAARDVAISIDHCFDVKGAGTVVLGRVESGTVRRYDKLVLRPGETEVLVRSIQMHDDAVEEAGPCARVGLAIKGAKPNQIRRGDMLGSAMVSREITGIARTQHYKNRISAGEMCMISIGLGVTAGVIGSTEPISVKMDRPVPYRKGMTAVVLKPESTSVRIMGSAKVT